MSEILPLLASLLANPMYTGVIVNALLSVLPQSAQELDGPIVKILLDAEHYATRPVNDNQLTAVAAIVKKFPHLNTEVCASRLLDLVNYHNVALDDMFTQRLRAYDFETVALAYEYVAEMPLSSGGLTPSIRSSRASRDVGSVILFIDSLRDIADEPLTAEELDQKVEAFGGFAKVRGILGLGLDVVALRIYDDMPEKDLNGYPVTLPEEQDEPDEL